MAGGLILCVCMCARVCEQVVVVVVVVLGVGLGLHVCLWIKCDKIGPPPRSLLSLSAWLEKGAKPRDPSCLRWCMTASRGYSLPAVSCGP